MPIPQDYEERVYAGILGKIIGVYVGRPFEGWWNDRIEKELGEINYYVHRRLGKPLIVADDDISGTFVFVRALEDHGISRDITAEQIGRTWLNYLIEKRTILWWGGMGNSTEHTAYLRLKHGIPAPRSGSIELNTKEVSEQIGAQIFIDGWAMVAPGEPQLAADLARKAGSVSHDGEAIYGAQVVAAMEAAAFFESDIDKLLDTGLSFIPDDCVIARLIGDLRDWRVQDGDWRKTLRRIEQKYGYDTYGGNCHMVPNHALIILALLYSDDDFQKSMMIVNTAGWDTDCNSGNVGCLMGIKNGLDGLNAGPDWRGPVADRFFKISADGGDAFADAVRETQRICRIGRKLLDAPVRLESQARYHFTLPGSVQGFVPDASPECEGVAVVKNVVGHAREGNRSLAVQFKQIAPGRPARVGVQVFGEPQDLDQHGYFMTMSPSLFPGQAVTADVELDEETTGPISVALYVQVFPPAPGQPLSLLYGNFERIAPGGTATLRWQIPETDGLPIVRVGVECRTERGRSGTLYLDYLTWHGTPSCLFTGPSLAAYHQPMGWTNGVDTVHVNRAESGAQFTLIHDEGRGLLINGTQDWTNYRFSARVAPHMATEAGIGVRVGGMRRCYALLLCHSDKLCLLKSRDEDTVLAEIDFHWEPDQFYELSLTVLADQLTAVVNGKEIFCVEDDDLPGGGIALINTEGRTFFRDILIEPLS